MLYAEISYQHVLFYIYKFLFMVGMMDTAEEMFETKMKIFKLETTLHRLEDDGESLYCEVD